MAEGKVDVHKKHAKKQKRSPSMDLQIPGPYLEKLVYHGERPFEDQLKDLSAEQRECFDRLKSSWDAKAHQFKYSDEMILRFARASPGPKKFNYDTAFPVMEKYGDWAIENHFDSLNIVKVREQLETGYIIPLTMLKSKDGHDMIYCEPYRFFPGKGDLNELFRSMIYCLDQMVSREKAQTEGIAIMVGMKHFWTSNFSASYANTWFQIVQGRYPMRVRKMLMVDAPRSFGVMWAIIKTFLTKDFKEKVEFISSKDLPKYVDGEVDDYPELLGGKAKVETVVDYFVRYHYYLEGFEYNNAYLERQKTILKLDGLSITPRPEEDGGVMDNADAADS